MLAAAAHFAHEARIFGNSEAQNPSLPHANKQGDVSPLQPVLTWSTAAPRR